MSSNFNPESYGSVIAGLLRGEHLNPLGLGSPNESVRTELALLTIEHAFADEAVRDRDMAASCCAALWLYQDYLDESHRISQAIHTVEGSYWHGIMHRREPDFSNSKYWFRRVGEHPIFDPLRQSAAELAEDSDLDQHAEFLATQSAWDPFALIDLCQACLNGQSSAETLCRQIQQREWEVLFDYCYRRAVGS